MPRPLVTAALGLVLAGLGLLAWSAATAGETDRPVRGTRPYMDSALQNAAAAAYGRRVLVVHTPPLEAPRGEILESARAPGGWELYEPAPPGADDFAAALERVAAAAAADWDADRRLTAETIRTLAEAGVAIVFVEDGRRIVSPESAADEIGVSPEASVPGLRVRGAEPVMRVGTDAEGRPRLDVVTETRDFEDGLWGGRIVVEVSEAGRHVFAWPVEGARVTVDGSAADADAYSAALPLIALDLPAGDVTVDAHYGETGNRALSASAGALALTLGLVLLLLAFRAHPDRDEAPDGDPDQDRAA